MKRMNMKRVRRQLRRRGMTLIEIIVVVAIIGLLMAAVGVAVVPVLEQAKVDTARSDIVTITNALKTYYVKKGNYPDTAAGLKALVDAQILERPPMDPWQTEYVYLLEGGKPVVRSNGKDKQGGTEDDVTYDAKK